MRRHHKSRPMPARRVQSCITSVSFPATVNDLEAMIEDNEYIRRGATDLDTLLEFEPEHETTWTAPRWMTKGDILFFYHTASARDRVARVWREVDRLSPKFDYLKPVLDHAKAQADRYSRTIFGCAYVSGASHFQEDPEDRQHFRSHIYAPLGEVHIFKHPLSDHGFRNVVTPSPGGTLTPIHGGQFTALKRLLARQNELPEFLQGALPGATGLRAVTRHNWARIACAPTIRFIDESQLRVYLLDFFLAGLKDVRTPLLEECTCYRNGARTGVVDYFVCVQGTWLPVEAKLNLRAERNLRAQVSKYLHLDAFTPQKGPHRGESFEVQDLPLCVVIDQEGVYLLSDGRYIGCRPGTPIWRREELGQGVFRNIRSYLAGMLSHNPCMEPTRISRARLMLGLLGEV